MRCKKGNVGTHLMRMPNVGKEMDTDLGLGYPRKDKSSEKVAKVL